MSIWSFKRKRYSDGRIMKYKARICAHGRQQSYGINYWETYSPLVNRISVRLLLTICQLHNLNSESIDFVSAFPQAELDVDIYMMILQGMKVEAQFKPKILKLEKNLYRLKPVSRNWFEMIKKGLEQRGFSSSKADPCVCMKEDMIVLLYVYDMIVVSRTRKQIEDLYKILVERNENFKLA